jgi:hypothetical protein
MKYRDAIRLHNGDEVIDKETNESIKVLSITVHQNDVVIEGIGDQQGYAQWGHRFVK